MHGVFKKKAPVAAGAERQLVSERGKHKPERRSTATSKLSRAELEVARSRFEENLYPKNRTRKEQSREERCAGAVIDRLDRKGLPANLAKAFLWNYATGADQPRADRRERGRIRLELLHRKAQDAGLREQWAHLHGRGPEFSVCVPIGPGLMLKAFGYSEPGQGKTEAERQIKWIKKHKVYDTERLGQSHLEYLIELQVGAECVGDHITEGELAELVDAAVTAVRPKVKDADRDAETQQKKQQKEDKTAALAAALRRFRERFPEYVEEAQRLIRSYLLLTPAHPKANLPADSPKT